MSILNWPACERPREKLMEHGAQTLSNAELLAVFFGTGNRGGNAVDLAHQLLARFGSLRELLGANREQALAGHGLGPARYCMLQAALELARRHYRDTLKAGPALDSPDAARGFLLAQLRDRPYEVFCCMHLNSRHQLIAFEEMFRGTIDGASVHPREVVKAALARNAAAVILAHNHPLCGIAVSPPRHRLTRRITGHGAEVAVDGSTVRGGRLCNGACRSRRARTRIPAVCSSLSPRSRIRGSGCGSGAISMSCGRQLWRRLSLPRGG
jgi:DNA repair protein RadC